MDLEFIPYAGALPLRFGMSRAEVLAAMGLAPHSRFSHATRDHFDALGVNYDGGGLAAEFCLYPGKVRVLLDGTALLEKGTVSDPLPALLERDPEPMEVRGFLIFPKLGVNLTGFHDGDEAQLAFNVFRRGLWDAALAEARRASVGPSRPTS